jgi:arylsulfatase A-like enzyme
LQLVSLVLLAALWSQGPLTSTPRPDVILVVADDLAHADVQEIATPNIDRLAAQGMSFASAYANPVCTSTRRALTFGRFWTDAGGVFCGPPDALTPGAVYSLPQLARAAGYRTALFGKWHVGSNPDGAYELAPQFHGYDVWRAGIVSNIGESRCGRGNYYQWRRVDDGVTAQETRYTDEVVRDEFLAWWNTVRGPRFAVVSFQLAHEPFQDPPSTLLPPGTAAGATWRARYENMVQALDTLTGQVTSVAGPEDIVLFLGDNGTPPGVAPDRYRAKGSTFERGIHVPLIVRAPFVKPGQVSDSLVQVSDVFATFGELWGRRSGSVSSVSFLPILLDPRRRTRSFVLCGMVLHATFHPGFGDRIVDRCVRSSRYKLRVNGEGHEQFYDLALDPSELAPVDLADPAYLDELGWHRAVFARCSPYM